MVTLTKVLHIRRLVQFEPEVDDWLSEQIAAAQSLFKDEAGIDLVIDSDVVSPVDEGVVPVQSCVLNAPSTSEQLALFAGVTGTVPVTEIVVFVVRDFFPWKGGGCAWHPPGQLGCMVVAGNQGFAQWKLAHELGHVFGLFHNVLSTMVMFASVDLGAMPPYLSQQEVDFLQGNGPPPVQRSNESLALSEEALDLELRKIEPDYRRVKRHGHEAAPLLSRIYEKTGDPEYRARAVYALSLVSNDMDEILISAANSPDSFERRAAAEAAGRLRSRPIAERILSGLQHDTDPSVRYVARRSSEHPL